MRLTEEQERKAMANLDAFLASRSVSSRPARHRIRMPAPDAEPGALIEYERQADGSWRLRLVEP
jgi:hypothetical protein